MKRWLIPLLALAATIAVTLVGLTLALGVTEAVTFALHGSPIP